MNRKLLNEELGRLNVEQNKEAEKLPVIIILDNVRSMYNIGAIFRTADAFRVQAIYLCGMSATPPHREIHKTALGAEEAVKWKYYDTTLDALQAVKEDGYAVAVVEQTKQSVQLQNLSSDDQKGVALVFGHEVNGVNQEVVDAADQCIEIPQFGTKHSLNIAVSVGVVLWELTRKASGQLK